MNKTVNHVGAVQCKPREQRLSWQTIVVVDMDGVVVDIIIIEDST